MLVPGANICGVVFTESTNCWGVKALGGICRPYSRSPGRRCRTECRSAFRADSDRGGAAVGHAGDVLLSTTSSKDSLPASMSCRITVAVMVLVMLPMRV